MSSGISLSGNTRKVINDLEKLKASFDLSQNSRLRVFCEIIAEAGQLRAEELYKTAVKLTGDETPTVNSAYWLNDTTMVLTASGKDILFIEFGTGILNFGNTYPTDTPDAARNAQTFYGSSYSATHTWIDEKGKQHGGWLIEPKVSKFGGWWPYGGEWQSGNPPAKAMYEAGKRMREVMEQAAKVAFR